MYYFRGILVRDKFKELKRQSTIKISGHGAFGEPESREQLDVDKFAQLIVKECISIMNKCDGDLDYAIYTTSKHFGIE